MPPAIPTRLAHMYNDSESDPESDVDSKSSQEDPTEDEAPSSENPTSHVQTKHALSTPQPRSHSQSHQVTSRSAKASPNAASTPVASFTASSFEALRSLPERRPLPWRPGQEVTDEFEIKRPQQKGAILMSARGVVQDKPCKTCENGNGRFALCVALPDYFGGACASCVFPSKGSACTLRKDKVNVVKQEDDDSIDVLEPPKKRKRTSTVKAQESSAKKKKVTTPQSRPTQPPRAQPPQQTQVEVQVPYEPPKVETRPVDLLNATYKRHKNDRLPSPPFPSRKMNSNTPNGTFSAHPYGQPARPPAPAQHEDWATTTKSRTALPSSLPPQAASQVNARERDSQAGLRKVVVEKEKQKEQKLPLIDTFSKSEQRQVYSLIHGLQGGIDSLNKQLGSLKGLLGIDEDV